ncbi:MAG: hypothetical protein GXY55_14875 [Phycisphaerae bacterium]|nr:hypothetical protein [Phycisphaerae bacterium]
MIDLSCIYRNPTIPAGYYFAKIVQLDAEQIAGYERPRIQVCLLIHPRHEVGDDVYLHAIIHPTEQSVFRWVNFRDTFLGEDEVLLDAVGRWGRVAVEDAEYQGTQYSSIKWIYQTPLARLQVRRIAREEREGKMLA